jgi:hypothetical protein
MATELSHTTPLQIVSNGKQLCPRCGVSFVCGIANGESVCWCFGLPNVIFLDGDGAGSASACLCPQCLHDDIVRKMGFDE